jgi:hypothetical protein
MPSERAVLEEGQAMEHYVFEIVDNHVVVRFGGGARVLLDTGSPSSFGRVPCFRLLGSDWPVEMSIGGLTVDALEGKLGFELSAAWGGCAAPSLVFD